MDGYAWCVWVKPSPPPLHWPGLAWPGLAWPGMAWHGTGEELCAHIAGLRSENQPRPNCCYRCICAQHPSDTTPRRSTILSLPPPPSTPLLSMSPPSSANFSTLLTFSQWMETVFRGREGEGRREKNRKHFRKQSTFRGGALFFLFPSLFFSLFSDLRRGWGEGGFVDWRIFGSLLCFLSEGMK